MFPKVSLPTVCMKLLNIHRDTINIYQSVVVNWGKWICLFVPKWTPTQTAVSCVITRRQDFKIKQLIPTKIKFRFKKLFSVNPRSCNKSFGCWAIAISRAHIILISPFLLFVVDSNYLVCACIFELIALASVPWFFFWYCQALKRRAVGTKANKQWSARCNRQTAARDEDIYTHRYILDLSSIPQHLSLPPRKYLNPYLPSPSPFFIGLPSQLSYTLPFYPIIQPKKTVLSCGIQTERRVCTTATIEARVFHHTQCLWHQVRVRAVWA